MPASRPRRPKTKTAGVGLCCQQCGQPTRVLVSRPVGAFAVDRVRICVAAGCGWRGRSEERFAASPAGPVAPAGR